MKHILITLLTLLVSATTFGQNADYQRAVAKYKTVGSVTATAVKTTHRNAVAKDQVITGKLYTKKPGRVLITSADKKDALLMNGTAFTMTMHGRKAKTDSRKNPQFATFHDVLESVYNGGTPDISRHADIKITKSGHDIVLTITPTGKKRQMFSSFVITINSRTSEVTTLRMNQKSGYTEYRFSDYKFGAPVADNIFK